ncbi:hypothetical protein EV361DRAFT_142221 [Lentinula raphanica]|nr:hypothetical protein C8R42DRAFT_628489 [Lentinula raphanica]KAJ3771885.1 hypothetical protein FB446DRAFT_738416 [Lentinula raphanica]KAJ3972412.1 hypothetical protein EV361DRAFT_142221 [Lentinula raphanica]
MKPEHKPLRAYRTISLICVFLLFSAFVLLLLVGVSLPIVHPVYIMRVYATPTGPETSLDTELRFGVWGVCAYSQLNPPSVLNDDGLCYGPRLGYQDVIPASILAQIGLSTALLDAALKGLLAVLIIHIVAAGFSLAGLFTSLFLASHGMTILSLVLTVITAILATVVFVVDVVITAVARAKIPEFASGLQVGVGNGVWMVLAALVASWAGVVFLSARACFCCGVRRRDYKY